MGVKGTAVDPRGRSDTFRHLPKLLLRDRDISNQYTHISFVLFDFQEFRTGTTRYINNARIRREDLGREGRVVFQRRIFI